MSVNPVSDFGPRGGWYGPHRPIQVPARLDSLRGPVSGVIALPLRLAGSTAATYDLSDLRRRALLYEVVIVEGRDEDFAAWLNREALIEAWPRLYLPRPVRAAWEEHHPVLATRGAGPDVPQP